jgi:hypothetical protein
VKQEKMGHIFEGDRDREAVPGRNTSK